MTTPRESLQCRPVYGRRAKRALALINYAKRGGFPTDVYRPVLKGSIWRLHLGIPTRSDLSILERCMNEQMLADLAEIARVIVDAQFLEALDALCRLTESLTGVPVTKEQRSHLTNKLFWRKFSDLHAELRAKQKQQEAFTLLREEDRAPMLMLRKAK